MQLIEERLRSLMLQSLAADAAAYRLFLDELTTHLRSYLRRRLAGLPDEVEDLLQELLLAIHNKRHTYDPKQPLTAWVQAIARYKLVDLLRRRSRSGRGARGPSGESDRRGRCSRSGTRPRARRSTSRPGFRTSPDPDR